MEQNQQSTAEQYSEQIEQLMELGRTQGYLTYAEINDLLPEDVIEQININIKYDGYIRRQLQQVAQFKKMESRKLDENFDYSTVGSLRREAVQKLNLYKPANIGQASRIAGVSPADISVLLVHLEQSRHAGHGEEKKEL